MESRLIWQIGGLSLESNAFNISLERVFAQIMIKSLSSVEAQERMNKLAEEYLEIKRINWKNPYQFYRGTGIVTNIGLGMNGTWLEIDFSDRNSLLQDINKTKPIRYYTHNVDTLEEKDALIFLFDKWVNYSRELIK
tara:strand:+ start:53 stop:463 length:411 start_codon:yes stop_codon:yes gene_type:complete